MSHQAINWALKVTTACDLPPSAALLLVRLANYHSMEKGCFPYQKKLMWELGMSQRQMTRNLQHLKQTGLVKVVRYRRGRRYLLGFEIADDCNVSGHSCPPDTGHTCPPSVDANVQSPPKNEELCGHKCPVHLNPLTPEKIYPTTYGSHMRATNSPCGVSEEDSEGKEEGPGDPDPENPGSSESNSLGSPEGSVTGKELPVSENEVAPVKAEEIVAKQMKPKTEAEILAKVEKARKSPKGVTPTVLGHLWRDLHGLYLPEHTMAGMTHVQMKQLAQAAQAAGGEFVPALVMVLKDWDSFSLHCQSLKVFPPAKPMPETVFVLKNIQIVVHFYRENLLVQSAALSTPPKKVITNPVGPPKAGPPVDTAPVPVKQPATLEEVEAILKGTFHGA